MHKLDKYATLLVADKNEDIIRSPRSSYYKFGGRILRISDHIGLTSSGSLSLIKTNNPDVFICHRHSTGDVNVMSYKEAKMIIKTMMLMAPVYNNSIDNFKVEQSTIKSIQTELDKISNDTKKTILGYPLSAFTKGQIKSIKKYIEQNKDNHGN